MRIATLLAILPFCEPNEAASQAIPNPLLGSNSNKNAQKSGPLLAGAARQSRFGRAFALGLIVLGLAACGSGGQAADAAKEAAVDAADSAATMAASASGADAETSDSDSKPTSDGTNMLESDDAKASYAMGFGVTGQVTSQFSDAIDHDAFVAGVRAQLEGKDSAVSQEDAQRALTALNETQRAKQALVASATAKEGAKFLADNAAKDGVVTTATGLQYLVLQDCLLYTSPSPRDATLPRMPSSA